MPDLLLDADGARGHLWWNHGLRWHGRPAGAVGQITAASPEALTAWLGAACDRLRAEGCALALGPLDGTSWGTYRLVADAGEAPPFLLDVDTPPAWPAAFADAGFSAVARYTSTEGPIAPDAAPTPVPGVTLRPLDLRDLDGEAERLYPLVDAAFSGSPAFVPLPPGGFRAHLHALAPLVVPGLALVATTDDRPEVPVGFVFAYPDIRPNARADTLVLKTLAVAPAWAGRGVGRWLADAVEARGAALGMTRVVHALMLDQNTSRRMSGHRATHVRRRYALLGRTLDGQPLPA